MKLFIVYEESHGDVSYWTDEDMAKLEVIRLNESCNESGFVDYYEVELNKQWK